MSQPHALFSTPRWIFKVMVEVALKPVTYAIVGFLKRAEKEDFYECDTNCTPFSLAD